MLENASQACPGGQCAGASIAFLRRIPAVCRPARAHPALRPAIAGRGGAARSWRRRARRRCAGSCQAGRGRYRHRQQRRAAARFLPALHPRPPERARRLVAAAPARRRRALSDLQEESPTRPPPERSRSTTSAACPRRVGEIRYPDAGPVAAECADFSATLDESRLRFVEPFLTAPSPGMVSAIVLNEHYPSEEAFLDALGRRAARRVRGHRRRGLPAAARLPGSRAREAQHLSGPAARGFHRASATA